MREGFRKQTKSHGLLNFSNSNECFRGKKIQKTGFVTYYLYCGLKRLIRTRTSTSYMYVLL